MRYMFSCLKFEAVQAKPLSVYLMIRVVCHFTVWLLHRASEQLQKCNTDVSVWYRPPSIAPPPTKIHTSKGYFIYFPKQNPPRGGGATVQAHKVGLPLWLHLHILQESSTTTEFISYFREPGRSTTASPPCQPQDGPQTRIQRELERESPVIWQTSGWTSHLASPSQHRKQQVQHQQQQQQCSLRASTEGRFSPLSSIFCYLTHGWKKRTVGMINAQLRWGVECSASSSATSSSIWQNFIRSIINNHL